MNATDQTRGQQPAPASPLARQSFRRSVIFYALGSLVGLVLAGIALFTAKGTSTLVVPPEDVALVNQQPISRSDYYLQLKALFEVDFPHATAAQRKQVLNDMVREELLVQRGKELDVASVDPDVRNAMVSAVEQGIAADVIAARPSDDKLMDYYKAHPEAYSSEGTMTVRDLVFPTAEAAGAAAQALKSGAAVGAVLVQQHGRDSGKVDGEEFYFAAKIHLGETLFKAARALSAGQVSGPLAAADGVHVLAMQANTPPTPDSFDQARAKVFADYQKAAVARLQGGDDQFFRKRANILIAKDLQ
jgi:parvulin-like peptidyl-prolyl isomerase